MNINPARFPLDRLTFVTFPDGDVTAYLGPVPLCCADSREAAEEDARLIVSAYYNGSRWARRDYPALAGLLYPTE